MLEIGVLQNEKLIRLLLSVCIWARMKKNSNCQWHCSISPIYVIHINHNISNICGSQMSCSRTICVSVNHMTMALENRSSSSSLSIFLYSAHTVLLRFQIFSYICMCVFQVLALHVQKRGQKCYHLFLFKIATYLINNAPHRLRYFFLRYELFF